MTEHPAPDLADPATYTFFQHENVRFSDTDMVGHVNNVAHVALVEAGRIGYALSLTDRVGVAFGRITFVHLDVDFRGDLYYPSAVRIGARMLAVGRTSFTVGTGTFEGARCVCTARNVMVHLGDDRRPAPIPDDLRAVMEAEMG